MQPNQSQLDKTSVDFFFPTPANHRDLLYYPVSAGFYECLPSYSVQRNTFSSYLLIVMLSGSLSFQTRKTRGIARPGQALLLDCNSPHYYGAQNRCSFTFVHFDGAQSREIYDLIERRIGNLVHVQDVNLLHETIGEMINIMRYERVVNEAQCSSMVYTLLMQLLQSSGSAQNAASGNTMVDRAIALGCKKVQLFKPYFNADTVKKAHEHGIICNVFWSDDPEETKQFRQMGIDTILTNDYNLISQVVER